MKVAVIYSKDLAGAINTLEMQNAEYGNRYPIRGCFSAPGCRFAQLSLKPFMFPGLIPPNR